MDEPLASLDEARQAEILPYIERLRDEAGVPILYVSHSVAEVARLATTVVILTEGQVTAVGPVADILSQTEEERRRQRARGDGGAPRRDLPALGAGVGGRRVAGAAAQRPGGRRRPRLYPRAATSCCRCGRPRRSAR